KAMHLNGKKHCNLHIIKGLIKTRRLPVLMAPFNKKILLMKLSAVAVLLTISGLLTARNSHSQNLDKITVSIQLKDATLKHAFRKIESLTHIAFTYKTNDVSGYGNINISSNQITIARLLDELLLNTGLQYEQVNDNVIIKKGISSSTPASGPEKRMRRFDAG